MITRYKTKAWTNEIEERDFIGETKDFLIISNNRRTSKLNKYEIWHETKELAILHLEKTLIRRIEATKERAKEAEKELHEFYKMYLLKKG